MQRERKCFEGKHTKTWFNLISELHFTGVAILHGGAADSANLPMLGVTSADLIVEKILSSRYLKYLHTESQTFTRTGQPLAAFSSHDDLSRSNRLVKISEKTKKCVNFSDNSRHYHNCKPVFRYEKTFLWFWGKLRMNKQLK